MRLMSDRKFWPEFRTIATQLGYRIKEQKSNGKYYITGISLVKVLHDYPHFPVRERLVIQPSKEIQDSLWDDEEDVTSEGQLLVSVPLIIHKWIEGIPGLRTVVLSVNQSHYEGMEHSEKLAFLIEEYQDFKQSEEDDLETLLSC